MTQSRTRWNLQFAANGALTFGCDNTVVSLVACKEQVLLDRAMSCCDQYKPLKQHRA